MEEKKGQDIIHSAANPFVLSRFLRRALFFRFGLPAGAERVSVPDRQMQDASRLDGFFKTPFLSLHRVVSFFLSSWADSRLPRRFEDALSVGAFPKPHLRHPAFLFFFF